MKRVFLDPKLKLFLFYKIKCSFVFIFFLLNCNKYRKKYIKWPQFTGSYAKDANEKLPFSLIKLPKQRRFQGGGAAPLATPLRVSGGGDSTP